MNRALKVAIVASGKKQQDVAKRAGMDPWRLSRIMHEVIMPKPEERAKIARILRVPVESIFAGLPEVQP